MSRLVALAFGVLVLATVGAFFVTQRLKRAPPVVLGLQNLEAFSPNGDGRRDTAFISFFLKRSDQVSVSIINGNDDVVRQLASERHVPAHHRVTFTWNGRTDTGPVAPDGYYQWRVGLAQEGRSLTLPFGLRLDTAPPRPRIVALQPAHGAGPEILPAPGVRAVRIRVAGVRGLRWRLMIYRTDVSPPRLVGSTLVSAGSSARWDGTLHRRPAPPGTYLLGMVVENDVGTFGSYPTQLPPRGGEVIVGRPGVTIRYLAAAPPLTPVRAGAAFAVGVDSRGRSYRWSLRRLGARHPAATGGGTGAVLRLRAAGRAPGLYEVTLRSAGARVTEPIAVDGRRARVLVVLPALSWQGRNPVDDDGDGLPNLLSTGGPVVLDRPFAGDGLPVGFDTQEQPLLRFLDAARLPYELTTDLALARGVGPSLAGHAGVILAGETRWLPFSAGDALQRYVRRGGRLLSLGTGSLRRSVRLSAGRLRSPSPPAAVDLLGSRLGRLRRAGGELVVEEDQLSLFRGTAGRLAGFDLVEPTLGLVSPAPVLVSAGPAGGARVLVAYRLGRGLVMRTGLPQWSERLAADGAVGAVMRRVWAVLDGG